MHPNIFPFRPFLAGILLCLGILVSTRASAAPPLRKDRGAVSVRPIPASEIDGYKAERDFQYSEAIPAGTGFWTRFWIWVWVKYAELMENKGIRRGFRVLGWVVPILLLLYAALRIAGMEKALLWVRSGGGIPVVEVPEGDIRSIDFGREIEDAVSDRRYRDAVRLHYLQSLRILSDKGIIRWTPNKTNEDYERELAVRPDLGDFPELTRIFEYAWYGEMPVSEADYRQVSDSFHAFNKRTGT